MTTSPAPIECEVFHTDILVASSLGGIQWVSSRAQGGKPVPCNMPLTTHMTPMKRISVLLNCEPELSPVIHSLTSTPKPKAKLASAQSASPVAMKKRALSRSARIPLTKRERP